MIVKVERIHMNIGREGYKSQYIKFLLQFYQAGFPTCLQIPGILQVYFSLFLDLSRPFNSSSWLHPNNILFFPPAALSWAQFHVKCFDSYSQ